MITISRSFILLVPFDCGDSIWKCTLAPPAEEPAMVILSGLPPNWAIFSLIHLKASAWSFNPMLPGTTASPVLRNPARNESDRCVVDFPYFNRTRNSSHNNDDLIIMNSLIMSEMFPTYPKVQVDSSFSQRPGHAATSESLECSLS